MPPGYKYAMMRPPAADEAHDGSNGATAAVELVVAVADDDAIGRANGLPWRLPADLGRFKTLTMGKTLLMGRKTHESIGRALPGRINLVLTRSAAFAAADCVIVGSLEEARRAASGAAPLMVIGGAEIYRQCLPFASRIHLTRVHASVRDADTFFAGWHGAEWRESWREDHAADERNEFPYSFVTLERARAATA